MNKCIYTLKTDFEATFSQQEHIFSAGICGIKKLPNGYVSDEFNNAISRIEREFMHNTPIMLDRVFEGIGHRGSKKDKDRTKSKIIPLLDSYTIEFKGLGFMDMGINESVDIQNKIARAFSIPSISFYYNTDDRVQLHNCESGVEQYKTFLTSFIEKLEGDDKKKYEIINDNSIPVDEICVGFYQKDTKHLWFYVAVNKEAVFDNNVLLDWAKRTLPAIPSDIPTTAKVDSYQPTTSIPMIFSCDELNRIPAKYIFNALAELKGHEFVLKACFNPIREWINCGEGKARCEVTTGKFIDIKNRLPYIPVKSHKIIFQVRKGKLLGLLSLFGTYEYSAIIADNIDEEFNDIAISPKIYVCDWENKTECYFDY